MLASLLSSKYGGAEVSANIEVYNGGSSHIMHSLSCASYIHIYSICLLSHCRIFTCVGMASATLVFYLHDTDSEGHSPIEAIEHSAN